MIKVELNGNKLTLVTAAPPAIRELRTFAKANGLAVDNNPPRVSVTITLSTPVENIVESKVENNVENNVTEKIVAKKKVSRKRVTTTTTTTTTPAPDSL